jgi:hypothetical protein
LRFTTTEWLTIATPFRKKGFHTSIFLLATVKSSSKKTFRRR